MNASIEVTTLSPMHIGSGQVLYRDLGFRKQGEQVVFDQAIVERPQLPCAHGVPREGEKELRLHLHDGNGRLLLPGSSIKGALKTLWIAEQLQGKPIDKRADALAQLNWDARHAAAYYEQGDRRQGEKLRPPRFEDKALVQSAMGGNFDSDPWQRLRVGDASFGTGTCLHIAIQNFHSIQNSRGVRSEYWKEKPEHWLLEAIPAGSRAVMRMDWPWWEPWGKEHATWREGKATGVTPARKPPAAPLPLFAVLRKSMLHILESELAFWDKDWATDDMADYVAFIHEMQHQAAACAPEECIVRIGYGSGFHAITGRIPSDHIREEEDWQAFFRQVRRDHSGRYPDDLPTPKTRKTASRQQPFGFVRLRIQPR